MEQMIKYFLPKKREFFYYRQNMMKEEICYNDNITLG